MDTHEQKTTRIYALRDEGLRNSASHSAGKNFERTPIDITYYYCVSVWIWGSINTMSSGHNPVRSD